MLVPMLKKADYILVTGSRDWDDQEAVEEAFSTFGLRGSDLFLIDGMAAGADSMCHAEAVKRGMGTKRIAADWDKHGKAAGPIRNSQMLALKPALVIAFSNDLPNSRGTLDTVKKAIAQKRAVYLVSRKNGEVVIEEISYKKY